MDSELPEESSQKSDLSELKELDTEWMEAMNEGLSFSLENFADIFNPSDEDGVFTPINLSPITLSQGLDEREYSDLSEAERAYLKQQLFDQLEMDEEPEILETYESSPSDPDNPTMVIRIFRTGRSKEGLFLHEIQQEGEPVEYIVASADYRL